MTPRPGVGSVCVFCGSSDSVDTRYLDEAAALGRALADREIELVYGGAGIGTMGALADAALAAGGRVTGVIPRSMVKPEVAHANLTALHVVDTMHQRKALMAELADAFVALPGGFGTLDELAEILTWRQLGLHDKPVALFSVHRFFDPLLAFVDHAVAEGFVKPLWRDRLVMVRQPEALWEALGLRD
jgi:uncharacterized protein (TIGR00730 family)